jgi:hypothetical protein
MQRSIIPPNAPHSFLSHTQKGKDTRVSSFARVNARGSFLALIKIHLPFFISQLKKASKLSKFNFLALYLFLK